MNDCALLQLVLVILGSAFLLVEWLGVVSNIGKKVAIAFTTIYMQLVCRYTIDRYQFKHGCMRKASNNDLLQ